MDAMSTVLGDGLYSFHMDANETREEEKRKRQVFGQWLQDCLTERDLVQTDLANKIEYGTSIVSKWCNGIISPKPDAIVAIADVLQLSPETVLHAVVKPDEAALADPARPQYPPQLTEAEAEALSEIAWSLRRVAVRRRERAVKQKAEGVRVSPADHQIDRNRQTNS